MIVITGLQDVYYNVSDMARAVTFYRDVLGLELVEAGEYWSSFRVGDASLGLHWTEGPPVPPVPRDSHGAHAGGTLTFATDDIDASLTTLRDRSVRILGTLNEPWGRLVVFEDPDGNVLKIMAPPE